jgi:hypothetical protein
VKPRADPPRRRAGLRSQKVAIITEVMQFTEDEDAKFWPIYREYEAELAKLNDERIAAIRDYAGSLEGRRNALKSKYYARFKAAISPKTAARYLQVENQILLLFDLQVAAALPLAPR